MFSLINFFFGKSSPFDLQPNESKLIESEINNIASSNDKKILFDYKKDVKIYLNRCKPILKEMLNSGLLQNFVNCKSADDFIGLNKEYFNKHDFEDIVYAKPILENLLNDSNEILIKSYEDLDKIVKIIMKKYLLDIKNLKSDKKVSIEVNIESSQQKIKVVSYNHKINDEYKFKNPGGTINIDEEPINAAKRELEEELGIIILTNRFELVNIINDKIYNYKITLDSDEYKQYVNNINKLEIDPEITMICLV